MKNQRVFQWPVCLLLGDEHWRVPEGLPTCDSEDVSLYRAASVPLPKTWYVLSTDPEPEAEPEPAADALPRPLMLADLLAGPLELLPAADLEAPAPVLLPLPVIGAAPPKPRPAPAPARPAVEADGIPLAAKAYATDAEPTEAAEPAPDERLQSTREVLAQASQALTWKDAALAPDPPLASRKEIAIGVSFALVTAIIGFSMTHQRLASLVPNQASTRRQVATTSSSGNQVQFRAPGAGDVITYVPYTSAGTSGRDNTPTDTSTPLAVVPEEAPTTDVPSATPTAAPKLVNTPKPVATPPPAAAVPTPPPAPPPPPAASMWPPGPSPRRPEGSLDNAWSAISPGMARVSPNSRDWISGVVVDSSGLVVTRWSSLMNSSSVTVQTNAGTTTGTVLGGLDGSDVALIKLPGGTYTAAPLAPEAPQAGDVLGYMPGPGSPQTLHEAHPVGELGSTTGVFRFMGVLGPGDPGNVLFNKRGEVSGVVLGKPVSFPGNATSLAADMSTVWRLMQTSQHDTLAHSPSDPALLNSQFRSMLIAEVSEPSTAMAQGTNIVPGSSMGLYRLGMNLSELQKALGTISDPSPMEDQGWAELRDSVSQTDFFLADSQVVAIRTTNPVFTTRRGVGVGALTVNIDFQKEGDNTMSGQWVGGESYLMSPGLELWSGDDGRVRRLLVEPSGGPNVSGSITWNALH